MNPELAQILVVFWHPCKSEAEVLIATVTARPPTSYAPIRGVGRWGPGAKTDLNVCFGPIGDTGSDNLSTLLDERTMASTPRPSGPAAR
jgi:hypothetical protein